MPAWRGAEERVNGIQMLYQGVLIMKYLIPVVAVSSILVAAFSASASDTREAIKTTQGVIGGDNKSTISGRDAIARFCPPFC